MDVAQRVVQILQFRNKSTRPPKKTAVDKTERKLANSLDYMKRRARGGKGIRSLSPAEVAHLTRIPGWNSQRWNQTQNTGTRRVKKGWEAYIRVQGTEYYGPARSTRTLPRADYLKLRAAADGGWATFATTFNALRPDRPPLDL